ncbi:MAG: Holliday junction resolvase RuvX [Gemmatimonadota bacterium]
MLGLDYGRRRIGVAVSDPTRTISSPHSVVAASPHRGRPPPALLDLIRSLEPTEIVLGIPLRMDGSEGEMAREARRFGRILADESGVPVREWDERLSSIRAERLIRDATASRGGSAGIRAPRTPGGGRGRKRGRSDVVAAALLLESYLRRTRPEREACESPEEVCEPPREGETPPDA